MKVKYEVMITISAVYEHRTVPFRGGFRDSPVTWEGRLEIASGKGLVTLRREALQKAKDVWGEKYPQNMTPNHFVVDCYNYEMVPLISEPMV